jgi:S-(hydroxymethyl)glutathione dehydrogenase/alcohol dehydrogenase
MKAAVSYEYGKPIEVVDIELGAVGPTDVRIEVRATGLCHSDVAVQQGALPFPLPMILGHEGAGVVVEAGSEVTQTQVGDHVVLSALIACGVCNNCVKGRPNLCLWGLNTIFSGQNPDGGLRAQDTEGQPLYQFASIGTLAEQLICSEKHAVPIPQDVSFEAACLTGCAVLTGMSAVLNRARVEAGKSVVVIGCGGVGLNVIQTAAMVNAGMVIAVDLHSDKLAMAQEFGATDVIQSGPGVDVPEAVRELTGGLGADYAFEVVGIPEIVRQGWDCLCIDGTLIAIGVNPAQSEVSLPASEFSACEKTLMACLYGTSRPTQDIPLAVELYRSGKYKLDELITHRFDLENINEAVAKMHAGHDARGIVVF